MPFAAGLFGVESLPAASGYPQDPSSRPRPTGRAMLATAPRDRASRHTGLQPGR